MTGEDRTTPRPDPLVLAESMVQAWAGCVGRLMSVAPIRAIVDETGIEHTGHTTPPEREAVRAQARSTVARWLARDIAALRAALEGAPHECDDPECYGPSDPRCGTHNCTCHCHRRSTP